VMTLRPFLPPADSTLTTIHGPGRIHQRRPRTPTRRRRVLRTGLLTTPAVAMIGLADLHSGNIPELLTYALPALLGYPIAGRGYHS
jgi:hypothetical protein